MLSKKISDGATLETLRRNFDEKEKAASKNLTHRKLQKYMKMKEKLEVLFAGKKSASFSPEQMQLVLRDYPAIEEDNCR